MIRSQRRLLAASVLLFAAFGCADAELAHRRAVERANRHMDRHEYKQAILEYRNALKAAPRDGEARYRMAEALMKVGRQNEAAREYVNAAELLPERPDVQIRAGSLLLSRGEFERARAVATAALKLDPTSVDAQLILAHALAGLKDLPAALREVEEAIEMAPEDSRPYTSLGTLKAIEGDRADAEAAYLKAIALQPRWVPGRLAVGFFYLSGRAHQKAETHLLEAVAIEPDNLFANRLLAVLYLAAGRQTDAEEPLLRLARADDPAATLMVADHYARTGRGPDARALYERLKKHKDARGTAVMRLASLEFGAGNRQQAYALLDQELAPKPISAEIAALKARLLLLERRIEEAEGEARKAVTANAGSAIAHYSLGLSLMMAGRLDEAVGSFKETLRLNPRAGMADLQLSRLMLAKGNPDDALRYAEAARRSNPKRLDARLSIASALVGKQALTAAEAEVATLLRDFPRVPEVHALHGTLLLARRDGANALRAFDRALELDPANLQALGGRLAVDLQLKRPGDARARLAKAIAQQPESAALLVLAAGFENSAGDPGAAERHLRAAIKANPARIEAYGLLGQILFRQRKLDEARLEFEEVARRAPDPVPAKTMIAIILELQNRTDDAIVVYEEITAASSRAPVAANNLAWHYAEREQNLDMALQLAQRAKAQLPESAEVDDTLGWVYYKKDMRELAIKSFETSIKKDPSNPVFHLHLGLAYAKTGRAAEAKRALERALNLQPGFRGAEQARKALASLEG